jgi:p-aminobenzoyl-glutamate transporter AbgT
MINRGAVQVTMRTMTNAVPAAILLAVVLFVAGCTSGESGSVVITPENSYWFPAMSSVIGIGLSADYSGSEDVTYEWSADYGGFLLWTPEVIPCEPPCTANTTVWWTYMTGDSITPALDLPGAVLITAKVIDPGTGEVLAQSAVTLEKDENGGYSISPAD